MYASVKQNVPACLLHKPKHKDYKHSLYRSQEQTTKLNVGLRAVMQNVTHEKWICPLTHQNAVFLLWFKGIPL